MQLRPVSPLNPRAGYSPQPRTGYSIPSVSPPPPGAVMSNAPLLRRPNAQSSIPTNLNYAVNRAPQSLSLSPNKLDINLNINVNNDGSISASTSQGAPIAGYRPPTSPTIQSAPQFLQGPRPQMMPMGGTPFGISMGQPIGQQMGIQVGRPMGIQGGVMPQQLGINGSPVAMQLGSPMGQPFRTAMPMMSSPFGNTTGLAPGAPFGYPYGIQFPNPTYLGFKSLDQKQRTPYTPPAPINTKIEDQRVYCVICRSDYSVSQRESHILKHQRQNEGGNKIRKLVKQYKEQYTGPEVRPIVEPEEYNIQYDPNQYIIEQQTIYSSPQYQPPPPLPVLPVQPIQPAPVQPNRLNIGIGTSDSAASQQFQAPFVPQPTYQPQGVRLTTDGQRISNYDPNAYQAGRQLKDEPIINPQPIPTTLPDGRIQRNTFVSDEPLPPTMQPSALYNRQTIQSQDFRNTQLTGVPSKVASRSPEQVQIQPELDRLDPMANKADLSRQRSYDANDYTRPPTINTTSQPQPDFTHLSQNNTLPQRDTVASQQMPNYDAPTNTYLTPAQRIAQNHASVMSPIKQESDQRQTISLGHDDPTKYDYFDQSKIARPRQYNENDYMRPASSQVNQPVSNDPYLARATANPAYTPLQQSSSSQVNTNQLSSRQEPQNNQGEAFLLDQFDYGGNNPNTQVISRQTRSNIEPLPQQNTQHSSPNPVRMTSSVQSVQQPLQQPNYQQSYHQPEIPFDQIIAEKGAPVIQPPVQPIQQPTQQHMQQTVQQPIQQLITQPTQQSMQQSVQQPIQSQPIQPTNSSQTQQILQSVIQPYQPQQQQPLQILQNTTQAAEDLKKKKLPRYVGGW